ncbi:MAG: hypothetical protein SWK76_07590 [Actinomycetota bacterium]|nr:hypothetical protein [Actinomycetota bacterium]
MARANGIPGQVSYIFSVHWAGPFHRPVLRGLKWLARHADFTVKATLEFLLDMERNKHLEGRRFTEIAEEQGRHPFEVMCDLLV